MLPRILIADDEMHIIRVLETKLKVAGYEVVVAHDGESAYQLAIDERPHLIVADYQMPRVGGLELCAKLRTHDVTRDIPVVMLTSKGYEIDQQAMVSDNLRKIVDKPFSPRELLSYIVDVLDETYATSMVR